MVEEAIAKNCNLIVSFHPIIFSGLKKLNGNNYVERTVIKAIQNNIAIYAIHTALDNHHLGVNKMICEKLHLTNSKILIPKKNSIKKLTTYIPTSQAEMLRKKLYEAGAGSIGNYDECSFNMQGMGSFRANAEANPVIGKIGETHFEEETQIGITLPKHLESKILKVLFKTHPYEEVDEKRTRGISMLQSTCSPEVILLDDAFQHRKVTAGLNILLTTYNELYVDDFILPTGNLREPASGAKRAQIIVVTKCPKNLTVKNQIKIKKRLKLKNYQKLFFSYIEYSNKVYSEKSRKLISSISDEKITMVTGIANPKPLCVYLDQLNIDFEHLNFPDHHKFTKGDLNQIMEAPLVLTTEKDFMRLKGVISHPNLYYIPIKMKFFGSKALEFDQQIERYVSNKK